MDRRGRPLYLELDPLTERHLTGIGRYTARLAMALHAAGADLRFFTGTEEVEIPSGLDWAHDQDLARWSRRLASGHRRPLGPEAADAVGVYPCCRPVHRRFGFEISVVYDLTPLLVPHLHSEPTRAYFQQFFGAALGASDAALAISHSTRADASWLTDYPQERLVVSYPGPSLCVERHLDDRDVARRPDVGLVVSTLEPRKNAFFLLDWFLTSPSLPRRAELWWVGGLGWMVSRRDLHRYTGHRERRVRLLGKVDDPTLCRLYRTAGWSVYPSLYEGFGFPVLDALRHGVPTLAAGHSSLREFAHPNLRRFDPNDPESLDAAWRANRERPFIDRGDELNHRFDWRRVAATLMGLPARSAPGVRVA